MLRIAWHTLRFRKTSFAATFAALLVGAAIVTACGGLLESGLRATGGDAERLRILAGVFSGWTTLIVVFGVSSMIALTVQQRHREIALLRAVGATQRQVRRMVVCETMVLAVLATALSVAPGLFLGRVLVDAIAPGVEFHQGVLPCVAGAGTALLAALGAGYVAGRRAGRTPGTDRLSRSRVALAAGFVAVGLSLSAVTVTSMHGLYTASTAGPASIWVAIGFALLAPAVVRRVGALLPPDRLVTQRARVEFRQLAAAVVPVTLASGIGVATLYMQATEDSVSGGEDMGRTIAMGNYAVVTMILGFAALILVNTLVAATSRRRAEFGLLRVAGSTRTQVLRSLGTEALVVAVVGVAMGSVASLATLLPFSIVRIGSAVPHGSVWIYVLVIGTALLLTVAATLGTTWRATRGRALESLENS